MAQRRTNDEGLLVFGLNAVGGLLSSAHAVQRVYLRDGTVPVALAEMLAARGVGTTPASGEELDRLTGGGRHQGVAARAGSFRYSAVEDVISAPGRGAVVLDGIMDPRNLGAIVRSSRASGVRGLVIPQDRSAAVTAAVVTASAGTIFGVPVARVPNLARAMAALKEAGMWAVGLAADADSTVAEIPDLEEPALVVGGEGEGLRRLVRERCDFLARIPMAEAVESLNASVATAIALYELVQRR